MTARFFNFLQFEKRCSAHTILAYKNDLAQLTSYLGAYYPGVEIEQTDHFMIRSWIVSLMTEKKEAASIKRKISCLRSFFRFEIKEGRMTLNPMTKVVVPGAAKQLPVFVEEKKMNTLLDQPSFSDDFPGVRDRLLIEFLYATGMRLSELKGLREYDVDLSAGQVKVLGKRNKERIIPFSPTLKPLIEHYLALKSAHFAGPADLSDGGRAFLVTDQNQALYPKFIYRKVTHYLGLVTLQDKRSPHILRHSFATNMLNKGADLNAIKELLGHASLAATQVYTHNSIERLKGIYEQAHPKA